MASSCNYTDDSESILFNSMLQTLLSDTVPYISVKELNQVRDKVTILDVREAEEYNVSRIHGSVHTGYDEFNFDAVEHLDKDEPIVVYCSVGYRSEKIGERLQDAGYKNVRNLYGGIFSWVNQNQDIVNERGPTNELHPYGLFWSTFITNETIVTCHGNNN